MKSTAILATLGVVSMTGILIYAFAEGSFAREGQELLAMPWGVVSLVDLYVGFFLFSAWILYRDGVKLPSVLWVSAVMLLGSLAISLYVLVHLRTSKHDWHVFFMGRHAGPSR